MSQTLHAAAGRSDSRDETVVLSLENITVRFGGITALDDVSVDVERGKISGLIGPNGAGKSTLLAVASGLQRVDAGRIILDGRDLTGRRPQTFASTRMARTFQAPQLVRELDIRQHVVLALRLFRRQEAGSRLNALGSGLSAALRGVTPDELRRANALLETLGLADVAHRGPMELPLGMRRLVEVAQCLATDPRILLLDEPSAGLNRNETVAFAGLVARLAKERGIAVLLVEHDMDLVMEISERLFVLDFGKLIASGPTEQVRKDPRVQQAYLGVLEEA